MKDSISRYYAAEQKLRKARTKQRDTGNVGEAINVTNQLNDAALEILNQYDAARGR
jgi:hypothetical protein